MAQTTLEDQVTAAKIKNPSLLGGAMIIAGTIVGAGMFSLPVVMSGIWFYWSIAVLVLYASLRINDPRS